jgi:predicted nucleic acid-binding protein
VAQNSEESLGAQASSGPKPLLIDTYAWIEYFRKTRHGELTAELIDVDDPRQPRFTHALCLYELRRAYDKRESEFNHDRDFLHRKATVIEETLPDWAVTGARLKNELQPYVKRRSKKCDLSTVDCILLAVAVHRGMRVVTGDTAFGILARPDTHGLFPNGVEFSITGGNSVYIQDFVYYLD